ncbi:MAG: hypothetical protein A2Y38_21450 [Spirochaetes bacterium GWB1_59_5]|nr:MAG: hypothetical protein A2Y38_21450 [Spirochaetes bacterium GWB1_59_5]
MGLFKDYFVNVLRLPFLHKPGPLAMLADGASGCLDAVRDVIEVLRSQFLPALCESAYLERFARSRGINRHPLEPEAHWLERVRFAYLWWSMGGRASAMAEALQIGFSFGTVRIINLYTIFQMVDEDTKTPIVDESTTEYLGDGDFERWAEFMVVAQLKGNEIRYTRAQIIWAINEIKPARSRLAALILMAPLYDEASIINLFDETTLAPLST